MAEFVAPQFQNPDFLGAYLRGQQGGQQAAAFPGQMQIQQQQIQSGGLELQQLRMALKSQQALQDFAMQNLNGQSSQGSAQSSGNTSGGSQNGPQGAVSSQTSGGYAASDYAGMIPSGTVPQFSAGTMNAIGMLGGNKMLEGIQANQKLQMEQRDAQMKVAQMKASGPLNVMDSVADSPNPTRMVMNNPSILAQWPAIAQKMGFDPRPPQKDPVTGQMVGDFDDHHVRLAALFGGNQIRTQVGITPREMPHPLQTTQRGLGESIQTDLVTSKISAGAPAMPTEKYIVGNQVVERPKAQGVAQGLTPYDSTLYGAEQITPQAMEQAYQVSRQTGDISQSLAGRDPIAAAKVSSFIAKRAAEDGLSGLAMSAQKQSYAAQGDVVKDFVDPNGKAGGKLQAINTVTEHAKALYPLIDAMKTGDSRGINAASLAWKQQFGSAAPTNYQAMANIFAGELKSAVTQNGGDASEREAIAAPFSGINSPEQLKGAIQTSATAMAGKTHALQKAWDVGTNGTQGPFEKLLTPATKEFLKGSSHPPAIQSLLDKYK